MPQPLRRHVVLGGISKEGSSVSDSGVGGGGEGARDCGRLGRVVVAPLMVDMGFSFGTGAGSGSIGASLGAGTGVSSTVECLPVVQGGITRNSSNVRTRGLQHFQPIGALLAYLHSDRQMKKACEHLSALHERWAVPDGKCNLPQGQ